MKHLNYKNALVRIKQNGQINIGLNQNTVIQHNRQKQFIQISIDIQKVVLFETEKVNRDNPTNTMWRFMIHLTYLIHKFFKSCALILLSLAFKANNSVSEHDQTSLTQKYTIQSKWNMQPWTRTSACKTLRSVHIQSKVKNKHLHTNIIIS